MVCNITNSFFARNDNFALEKPLPSLLLIASITAAVRNNTKTNYISPSLLSYVTGQEYSRLKYTPDDISLFHHYRSPRRKTASKRTSIR